MSKKIFITGTSSGFGLLTVYSLLSKGYTVFASMRQLEGKNASAAQNIKDYAANTIGKTHLIDLDVTQDTSVEAAIQKALHLEGNIDVLINNAGLGGGGYTEGFTVDQLQEMFNVNLFGVHRLMRAALPSMRAQGEGLIINVSSVMGRFVIPYAGAYTSTKFALEGLTETYRYEVASTGVDVLIVEPGGFATDFGRNMLSPHDSDRIQTYEELASAPDQMWDGFMESMEANKDVANPQLVADAMVKLIETPAGQRAFRTVIDPMAGNQNRQLINEAQEKMQSMFFEAMGMSEMVKLKTKKS